MAAEFFQRLSVDLTNLLENGEDYNVLIEVGEKSSRQIFKAHSIILNSRCSYFRNDLNNTSFDEKSVKKISKPHITVNVFKIIIKYIYSGIVLFDNVDATTTLGLLITANEFCLKELVDTVQTRLVENYASWMRRNFTKVYKLSSENDEFKVLQKFCNDIIAKHPSVVFNSEGFTDLPENALVSLLKLDNLQMDEGIIWDQVIRWGIAQNPDLSSNPEEWSDENFLTLKSTLQNCLHHIRYFHIAGEDILEKVQPYHQILQPNLWKDIMTKFMAPNKAIASTVLPPRVISSTMLPLRNTSNKSSKDKLNNFWTWTTIAENNNSPPLTWGNPKTNDSPPLTWGNSKINNSSTLTWRNPQTNNSPPLFRRNSKIKSTSPLTWVDPQSNNSPPLTWENPKANNSSPLTWGNPKPNDSPPLTCGNSEINNSPPLPWGIPKTNNSPPFIWENSQINNSSPLTLRNPEIKINNKFASFNLRNPQTNNSPPLTLGNPQTNNSPPLTWKSPKIKIGNQFPSWNPQTNNSPPLTLGNPQTDNSPPLTWGNHQTDNSPPLIWDNPQTNNSPPLTWGNHQTDNSPPLTWGIPQTDNSPPLTWGNPKTNNSPF